MQLRYEIQLASMIKALHDVVIPAIDPVNRLALEQSQLIAGMLSLMQQQLPLQYRFDRDELGRLAATLAELGRICGAESSLQALRDEQQDAIAVAQQLVRHSAVDPRQLHEAVRDLRERVGQVVSRANGLASEQALRRIESQVLELSRQQLLRDRALLAPQAWEPDPAALPAIESLLDLAAVEAEQDPEAGKA